MMYARLAVNGIRKNRKTYVPYFCTCTIMVMIFYIVSCLSQDSVIRQMRGGEMLQMLLNFGTVVVGIFSLIFLFYTNSFLIRRRKREFGLYNILGMGKINIARILIWETLLLWMSALVLGLGLGILFSKLCQLLATAMLGGQVSYHFTVQPNAIVMTFSVFAPIFLLILLNALRQISVSKPVELLHSSAVGEKAPKANFILAILGAAILAAAYYLAVTIQDPVEALAWFFIAVILVIIATYMLFIAGSVAICKLLQWCKGYYYKTNHFISVSSMLYRMKRNGAGLASICILCTMVLVTVSTTVCLYIGTESSLRLRYPRNITIDMQSQENTQNVQNIVHETLSDKGAAPENEISYRYLGFSGKLEGDGAITLDRAKFVGDNIVFSELRSIYFIPVEDYNKLMGTSYALEEGEVLLSVSDNRFPYDKLQIGDYCTYNITNRVDFVRTGDDVSTIVSTLYVIVPTVEELLGLQQYQAGFYEENASELSYYLGFDLDCDDKEQIEIYQAIDQRLEALEGEDEISFRVESIANERADYIGLNGGLFFLGILLGFTFLLGAVLIMYYKQITEGYEDQDRFEILQKVGMTRGEIRRSINSQVLTVFFLPLIAAGIHVCFAFHMVSLLMRMLGLVDVKLFGYVIAGCFGLFAVFYVAMYMATSRSYFGIVSGRERRRRHGVSG